MATEVEPQDREAGALEFAACRCDSFRVRHLDIPWALPVIFGGLLLCLGHFGMAFEGHAATVAGGVRRSSRVSSCLGDFGLTMSAIRRPPPTPPTAAISTVRS